MDPLPVGRVPIALLAPHLHEGPGIVVHLRYRLERLVQSLLEPLAQVFEAVALLVSGASHPCQVVDTGVVGVSVVVG